VTIVASCWAVNLAPFEGVGFAAAGLLAGAVGRVGAVYANGVGASGIYLDGGEAAGAEGSGMILEGEAAAFFFFSS
jgi:hypothetical protein